MRVKGNKCVSLVAAARGKSIEMPTMPLPVPLRVQVQTSGGACWESAFEKSDARKNGARGFGGRN